MIIQSPIQLLALCIGERRARQAGADSHHGPVVKKKRCGTAVVE